MLSLWSQHTNPLTNLQKYGILGKRWLKPIINAYTVEMERNRQRKGLNQEETARFFRLFWPKGRRNPRPGGSWSGIRWRKAVGHAWFHPVFPVPDMRCPRRRPHRPLAAVLPPQWRHGHWLALFVPYEQSRCRQLYSISLKFSCFIPSALLYHIFPLCGLNQRFPKTQKFRTL